MVSDLTTVVVCERWTMPIGQRDETSQWFVDWVLRRPADSSVHITAGFHAYSSLLSVYPQDKPFASAAEYFGGLGCQSLMIQNLFRPEEHTVVERHPLAAQHLKGLLAERKGARALQGDAYRQNLPADLAGLDFGNLTALQAQRNMRPLLNRVFAAGPKAVVLTDIAGQRLHLQRERYEKLLNHSCATYPDYLSGLAAYFLATYGYRALSCFHHRWSAVMALVPQGLAGETKMAAVPQGPEGLRLR